MIKDGLSNGGGFAESESVYNKFKMMNEKIELLMTKLDDVISENKCLKSLISKNVISYDENSEISRLMKENEEMLRLMKENEEICIFKNVCL